MTAPLPVRPTPWPREPLSSYAVRLADANGLTPSRVLRPWRHDVDVPHGELAAIDTLGGLDQGSATRLTMNRYPLIVRGHGPQRRHGWRLHHDVRWICQSCTPTIGHTDLLWQTALMPVCLRCGCYLVRAGTADAVRPASARVLELAGVLAELAEDAIDNPRARSVLYRLRRRCQARAATITGDTSTCGVTLPPIDVRAARSWGAYPSPDPTTVAALLVLTSPRTRSHTTARAARPHRGGEFTGTDHERLEWMLTRLRHHVHHDGLRPDHVPSMLPPPMDAPAPGPGAWLSRTRAATALYLLITQVGDGSVTPEAAMAALGVAGIPTCSLIDAVHTAHGLRERDADLLITALDQLIAEGLVDYQRRRDTLSAVSRLPTSARRRLTNPLVRDRTGETLALGWIWTRYTRGPMRSSPWPTTPDRDIAAFDTRLDPEGKLVLAETAQQLLADADALHATPMTWAPAKRRYG
ncbi:MAG: TniQ family protein [Kineosporiaceae bacterium]|nr:TniQ family protein [Kineosporiaceae bacterium]